MLRNYKTNGHLLQIDCAHNKMAFSNFLTDDVDMTRLSPSQFKHFIFRTGSYAVSMVSNCASAAHEYHSVLRSICKSTYILQYIARKMTPPTQLQLCLHRHEPSKTPAGCPIFSINSHPQHPLIYPATTMTRVEQ
ncbi:hypothetical protein AA313_de0201847 [Arthrobotrys entomopaga]|nr:hypothetical protein AA313_de0201847 [Arthrobotrys entomopaga]